MKPARVNGVERHDASCMICEVLPHNVVIVVISGRGVKVLPIILLEDMLPDRVVEVDLFLIHAMSECWAEARPERHFSLLQNF